MLNRACRSLSAAAFGATLLLVPAHGQTRHRDHNFNINVRENDAEHCAGLRAESDGEIARSSEAFTLSRAEAPTLEVNVSDHGNIRVFGASRTDYGVEVCKFAVAGDRATAEQMLHGVTVSRSAGRLSTSGPSAEEGRWMAYLIVHAPKDAPVNLETRNGAISVREMEAAVKVQAVNGPIAVRDCTGRVDANTVNGPIAFEGSGGDIHLEASNGPIAVKVSGEQWNGNQLEASTNNGPLSLKIPDGFRSGVRIETSGHSPMMCKAAACANATTDWTSNPRMIQMNGSGAAIRITTHNGPISIADGENTGKLHRII